MESVVDKSRTHGHKHRTKLKYAFHLSIECGQYFVSIVRLCLCWCLCVFDVRVVTCDAFGMCVSTEQCLEDSNDINWYTVRFGWNALDLQAHVVAIISNAFTSH